MDTDQRLARLEAKLCRTRRTIAGLGGILLLALLLAANSPLGDVVCGSLTVLKPDGKKAIELTSDGGVTIHGSLNAPQVPPGMMLPYFGKELPDGFVWADGASVWPKAEWVPAHLAGQKVPDMRSHLLGGAPQPADVGGVWKTGKIPSRTVSLKERDDLIPPPQKYNTQNLMAMVNAIGVGAAGADETGWVQRTWVRIPIKRYGGEKAEITIPPTELSGAEANPRHVMCRWIIRVK